MDTSELHSADEKKIQILRSLTDGKWYSYSNLQHSLGINFETIKQLVRYLEMLSHVETQTVSPKQSASGRARYSVKITEGGKKFLESLSQ